MPISRFLLTFLALLVWAGAAHAHPGHATSGFTSGFFHPLGGLDHLLAIVAVGLWAAQNGGRAFWLVPLCFVGLMSAAAAAGAAGVQIPFADAGIALSVIALGVLVAGRTRLPLAIAAVMIGGFGLAHGYVHGLEMPAAIDGLAYGLGFALATVLLHGLGIALGSWKGAQLAIRSLGGMIALVGVALAV